MPENIFTIKEAAALLKVPDKTVENIIREKKLSHFKIKGKTRISDSQIQEYLKSVAVVREDASRDI